MATKPKTTTAAPPPAPATVHLTPPIVLPTHGGLYQADEAGTVQTVEGGPPAADAPAPQPQEGGAA